MTLMLGQTEDQRLLADSVRQMLAAENGFEQRRSRLGRADPDRLALWKNFADLGVLGLSFPAAVGGLGGVSADLAALQDALGPNLAVEPVLAATVTAGRVLAASSGAASLIAQVIGGERIAILAHAQGFDPFAPPSMSATRKESGGYVLHGTKPAVRHAEVATDLLVTARLSDGTIGIFLLDADHDGITRERTRLIDAAGAADIRFDEVETAPDSLLVFASDPMAVVTDALEWTLGLLCVETASLIDAASRDTFEYFGVRKQFGQKLGSFQALQHRAADMAIATVESAAVASDAIAALDLPPSRERSRRILLASLSCDVLGRQVGHEAVQMHGGMGVSDELIISHYARRLAAIRNQVGSIDARQARLAGLEGDIQ